MNKSFQNYSGNNVIIMHICPHLLHKKHIVLTILHLKN